MKNPMFDDWDHFKGDFKSRPEKSTVGAEVSDFMDAARYIAAGTYGRFGGGMYSVPQMQKTVNYLYYSNVGDPTKAPELLPKLRGMSIGEAVFDEHMECNHDPIDVGFAKPKMVCKKCDKDL